MTDDMTREHERALLACALLGDAHAARNLLGMVQAPMFADPKLARAWSHCAVFWLWRPLHPHR